jgi:hypothetical protein
MALPTLDAVFASAADMPRKYMLAQWLVGEKEETQAPSSVLVSGAGASEVNGVYTYRGENGGKPYYNLIGYEDSISVRSIYWDADSWFINGSSFSIYQITTEIEYPWESNNQIWFSGSEEDEPSPTVTEISAPSPISNYYTLPERYLWAKIAVAAGAPRSEADYISLPKQYVWSDIYNAVSGDIAESTVVVSGLSATYLNGRYVYDGDLNGKPSYILTSSIYIYWESIYWILFNDGDFAKSESDVAYPWLATNWFDDGINPTGLVLTPKPPNHTDWSEKQALGHIAAAYRGDTGNPANLATYIDWPWRYQVAAIITAL